MSDMPANLNSLLSVSEVVTGLLLLGKQTPTLFSADKFHGKYKDVVKDIKAGKTEADLYLKYGNLIQPAKYAAKSVNGLGEELDWVDVVNKAYSAEIVGSEIQKAERYLQMGEYEKFDESLRRIASTRTSAQRLLSVPANEISDTYEAYIPSGAKAWDVHLGGIPNVGLIVIGAKTFTGKTTLAITMMDKFLHEYPNKKILFVTLEDMNEGWKYRAKEILGNRDKEFWERIRVMEFADNTSSIIEEAGRHNDIGAIFVDYLEYLTKESDVSTYTEVYKTLSTGAKTLAVANPFRSMPIFLLAQFGKTLYKGGVPTPEALPYVDQRFIYQQVMLYQPEGDFYSDNEENAYTLPVTPKKGYIICWKSKNARPHDPEFPGAIQVAHSPKYGYDLSNVGEWYSLAADQKREVKKKKG